MKKDEVNLIIDRKTANVVHDLSAIYKQPYNDLLQRFLTSDTYRKLADEETKYWRESTPYIVESYVAELNKQPINDDY